MLVSTIITKGQTLANVPNTNFYTPTEALADVQTSWNQIYEMFCEMDDDLFATVIYVASSSFSVDANRKFTYTYALPSDFFRLRLFQYQSNGAGATFLSVNKMTIENFGNTQNTPGYRLAGTNIEIYDPAAYQTYAIWYYPVPVTLATNTDLTYPTQMVPEIMSYQSAIEIRRKQKADTTLWEQRKGELIDQMKKQLMRDDNKTETIKNVFGQGFAPYV